MPDRVRPLDRALAFIDRHFLWLLLGSYLLAAGAPAPGLWLKDVTLGKIGLLGQTTKVTLSMVLLGTLLFDAGLGVRARDLHGLLKGPWLLLAGFAANL